MIICFSACFNSIFASQAFTDISFKPRQVFQNAKVFPGRTWNFSFAVENLSDVKAKNVEARISMPEHISFAENFEENCKLNDRTLICSYGDIEASGLRFENLVFKANPLLHNSVQEHAFQVNLSSSNADSNLGNNLSDEYRASVIANAS